MTHKITIGIQDKRLAEAEIEIAYADMRRLVS